MNALHRIIDANANRAREALRVMEDAARFGLDQAGLSESIKRLRHGLRNALSQPALDPGLLLAARDVEGDIGRELKTETETSRTSLADVAGAACARLTEALRSIEEAAKALGADSTPIERLRYQSYTVLQQLRLALGTGRCPQWRLCVLITEALCRLPWLDVAKSAIDGGADCLQLREKELQGRELLDRARRLVDLAAHHSAERKGPISVIINDRPDVALLSGAHGVHVGQGDLPAAEARRLAGFQLLIGVSTSNVDEALIAARAGADYCGVGPMFPTATKHKLSISGPAYLQSYLASPVLAQRPHLAIGGIAPDNIGRLVEAGCRGLAVSSVVCGAADPGAVCQSLIEGLSARADPLHA